MKRAVLWAGLFALIDTVWLLSLFVASLAADGSRDITGGVYAAAMRLWSLFHLPIRRLVEPALFPVVTSHPLSPSDSIFILYGVICIVQSALLGFVIGMLVEWMQQKRTRS